MVLGPTTSSSIILFWRYTACIEFCVLTGNIVENNFLCSTWLSHQQLNDELEQAVKISELLTREGAQMNVKTGKIRDLAQYQLRLKDTITEYEEFFMKIVAFHRMKAEVSRVNFSTT